MRSLNWKLWGALLLVVLLSVGLMAFLTNLTATLEFRQYLSQGNTAYVNNLAKNLADYYVNHNGWSGVQTVILPALRSTNERILIADNSGRIIADTENQLIGDPAAGVGLDDGVTITASGSAAGTLWVLTSGTQMRPGMGGPGRGVMGGISNTPTTLVSNPEEDFAGNITTAVIISSLISVVFALALGWILTRQITGPVLALNHGAQQIARGQLGHRVRIKSRDEIGTLAQSFNTMAANLENSEEERRRMIADIVHELRTPLTIIDGTVDAIMDGVFQPDAAHLNSVKEQTRMLSRLVGDLRDLSMADSGQLKLQLKSTDINDLLARQLTQLRVKAREKNIDIALDTEPSLPPAAVDSARIEQVISNLVTNAIRHTNPGGRIDISTKILRTDDNKRSVLIEVSDTGEGIAPEHLGHVFDRFYRVEPSRSRNEGGAGLGLAIVKQMILAHGGTVRVESKPGRGSSFFVSIPVND